MTGKLGLSLILMSIVVNIILRPFSDWASRVQNKERRLQEILAPQIAEIKREYRGAEQHSELSELYKRYAYNPLYAVRSGTDLFIQLLPLSAAYVMLSSLTMLRGQSFAGISDLSQPDGLIFGLNLLPIAMTVINFLATLTTERFTSRERLQAFIIAILFLIMLYNAPSALLVYWTSNNLIMLLKNLYAMFFVHTHERVSVALQCKISHDSIKFTMFFVPFTIWIIYISYFFTIFVNPAPATLSGVSGNITLMSCLFIFTFVVMFFANFTKYELKLSELITRFLYIVFGIILLMIISDILLVKNEDFRRYARYITTFLLIIQTIYVIGAVLLAVPYEKTRRVTDILTGGHRGSLFFASLMSMIFLFCVFYPALLYSSDQEFFIGSIVTTVQGVLKYGIGLLVIMILLWPMFPISVQNILAMFVAFVACISFINFFILTENYGQLSALQLNINTLRIGMRATLKDLVSITLSLVVMFICVKKRWIKSLINGFYIISVTMVIICCYYYFTTPENKTMDTQLTREFKFPEYHDRFWRFSKVGQNVIGFFWDGFTGDHVLRILEDDPSLREKLDGFIYFPDTLAVGSWTNLSIASIYGGSAYKPNILNKMQPNKTLIEKYSEAFSLYPNVFAKKGYDVAYGGIPFITKDNAAYFEKQINDINSALLVYNWGDDYVSHWLQWAHKKGFSFKNQDQQEYISRFSLFMALLRASPFSVRYYLYRGAAHFGVMENILSISLKNVFLPDISAIQFMGDFVRTDDVKPTFKMICSNLSHLPCFLPSDDLLPVGDPYPDTIGQTVLVNDVFPEHYYTERHMLYFLADFIDSLKKLGVYNNTRIVVVSDHDYSDSWKLHQDRNPFIGNSQSGYVWPNALLMFKDFNSSTQLKISNALMSIEDTPSLLMDGIVRVDGIPTIEELRKISDPNRKEVRIRTHCGMTLNPVGLDATQFNLDAGIFEVKGTIFKKENWTKVE